MKLIEKRRIGSKVKKIYEEPKTPYERVPEHPAIPGIPFQIDFLVRQLGFQF
ncbi:hypothetical protein [Thermosulfurimonas sp. F29]|uniref:hypothetical protein n=1 Tax=Thermosulfurimonas sp. F29 TaxID=2867247 RepID=UPI001C82B6DF|nr:hypothetical protein [Thermosulfurimonas sp. F29]MBX6423253.1 hypothetical protein [Thermosulfurimonas sp. F29]